MSTINIFLIVLVITSQSVFTMDVKDTNASYEFIELQKIYREMNSGLKGFVHKTIKQLLAQFIESGQNMNTSMNCVGNIMRIMIGFRDLKLWAISFPDSSGKVMDGFMSGNTEMLGNYDQCLATTVKKKNGKIDFQGKYCLINYKPYLPDLQDIPTINGQIEKINIITKNITEVLRLYILKSHLMKDLPDLYGLCVPSGCSKSDVQTMINYIGRMVYMNLTTLYCHTEADTSKLDETKICIIGIFILFGALCLAGTVTDYYIKRKNIAIKNAGVKFLLCFSVITNFQKVLSTKTSENDLSCFSGIKVLTTFYIILGHMYGVKSLFFTFTNPVPYFLTPIGDFFRQIVLNFFPSVDVFFLMGGFLNSYSRLKEGNIYRSPFVLVIHRIWRLYPTYIISILLAIILVPRGPMAPKMYEIFVKNCYYEWWKNLLFINNFFDQEHVCFIHSWYIACDMQYFLISVITVSLLKKSPMKGIIVNSAIILICPICTALWVWKKNIPPTFLFNNVTTKDMDAVYRVYTKPYTHAAPYFIGILMGYLFTNKKDWKFSKVRQVSGWIISGLLFTSTLFLTKRWNSGTMYTSLESSIYFSLSRASYSLAVAWMILCCITGYGGVINYILSLKFWIPIARISYSLYLISFIVEFFYSANKRTTTDTHVMILIWEYFGYICVCCLLSFTLVVLTETPLLAMEKIVFKKKEHKSDLQHVTQNPANENDGFQGNIELKIVENVKN